MRLASAETPERDRDRAARAGPPRAVRVAMLAAMACGSKVAPPPPPLLAPPPTPPVSVAPAKPSVRVDRAPLLVGGAPTWATAEVAAMRFCPGDRELVVGGDGRTRRYRVEDGAQLSVVDGVTASDCRADGTALGLDADGSPVLVDPKGTLTRPSKPINAEHVAFDGDAVMALTADGVVRWDGAKVDLVIKPHANALGRALGEYGTYVERVYQPPNKADEGVWWVRSGTRVKLPAPKAVDVDRIVVAPDGAVAIADLMMAYGWVVKNKIAGPQTLLLDQSGFRIDDIAATDKWFAVMDAGGGIWKTPRPAWKWTGIERPCGDNDRAYQMTVAHDDVRVAVACKAHGIRILDLATGKQLSKDGINTAGDLLAWSPSGAGLAVRDDHPITVWQGTTRIAVIEAFEGRALWWNTVAELGGISGGDLSTWTIADLSQHEVEPRLGGDVAARSRHGEIVVASRRMSSDGNSFVILDGDKRTPVPLPVTKHEWLDGIAIDDGGKRAVVWRGQYNGEPALEVIEIDVAAAIAKMHAITATAVALAGTGFVAGDQTGRLTWYVDGRPAVVGDHGDRVTALAVAGEVVAVGGADGAITLWWIKGGKLAVLPGHTAPIRALAFAPDGHRLASTASDGTRVWDLTP